MSAPKRKSPARATARRRAKESIDRPLIIGSLVTSARTCGNRGCKCAKGQKHINTYLAVKVDGKRKMICVPKHLESFAHRCVENHKNLQKSLELISRDCVDAFLQEKQGDKLF